MLFVRLAYIFSCLIFALCSVATWRSFFSFKKLFSVLYLVLCRLIYTEVCCHNRYEPSFLFVCFPPVYQLGSLFSACIILFYNYFSPCLWLDLLLTVYKSVFALLSLRLLLFIFSAGLQMNIFSLSCAFSHLSCSCFCSRLLDACLA